MISVCLLTHNDSKTLENCLQSVSWTDELIVVDDHSTDSSVALVKKLRPNAQVFSRELKGNFAAQRNFALGKASNEWVLFVDPDEEVSPKLKNEIETAITKQKTNGYFIKRRDHFFGKWLRFGETGQIKLLRLARKEKGEWYRQVHEYWKVSGRIMELKNPLLHYPQHSLPVFIKDLNFYSSIDAKHMKEEDNIKFSYFRVAANPTGKFLQNYFWRLGILDGMAGLVMAYMMSFYSLVVRVKLYER